MVTNQFLTWTINLWSLIIVILGSYKYWLLSKSGVPQLKHIYWLQIVTGVINIITNALIVVKYSDIWGILAFQILMIWSVVMSVRGLINNGK